MKKLFLIMFTFLVVSAAFGQVITINSIGMHKDGAPDTFEVEKNEDIELIVNYTVSGLTGRNQIKNYSFDDNVGQISLAFYSSDTPDQTYWIAENFYLASFAPNGQNGTFTLTNTINIGLLPPGIKSIQANLSLLSSKGLHSVPYSSHQEDSYYGTIVPLNSPSAGDSTYLTILSDTEATILASVNEYNPIDALAGYSSGAYQPIGYVALKASSGVATLTKMAFDVDGTIDAEDASHLALYVSLNNGFSGATQLGNSLPFNGIGKYTFTINNSDITNQEKYYFVAISLNANNLSYDDCITLSTNDAYITTSGTITAFNSPEFARKCLYTAIIVNYSTNFPSITPGAPNAPFFRLDVKTNDCVSSITSINLALTGTLTSNDVKTGGFSLWESTSPTFNAKTVTPIKLGGDANYNNSLAFSGFTSSVNSVDVKYYFFTVSTKSTANTEATIGGDILNASDIVTTGNSIVNSDAILGGFPLIGELQTLPVELSSFTASLSSNNDVSINWTVEAEIGLSGYYILRANSNDLNTAITISVLIPAVNSAQTYTYSFVDDELDPSINEYYYWLTTVELSNESETFGPVMVRVENNQDNDLPALLLGTALIGNYPNPFNPSTSISFSLEKPENVVINIYNIRGQLVRKLYNENVTNVNQRIDIVWDGKNSNGASAASGIYYARMIAGKHSESKKMILMK